MTGDQGGDDDADIRQRGQRGDAEQGPERSSASVPKLPMRLYRA
jgi:hypothetical protein